MMNASPAPQEIFLLKLGEVVLKGTESPVL